MSWWHIEEAIARGEEIEWVQGPKKRTRIVHGTFTTYNGRGCRCAPCTEARTRKAAHDRKKNPEVERRSSRESVARKRAESPPCIYLVEFFEADLPSGLRVLKAGYRQSVFEVTETVYPLDHHRGFNIYLWFQDSVEDAEAKEPWMLALLGDVLAYPTKTREGKKKKKTRRGEWFVGHPEPVLAELRKKYGKEDKVHHESDWVQRALSA